jgi:hypothetical protein
MVFCWWKYIKVNHPTAKQTPANDCEVTGPHEREGKKGNAGEGEWGTGLGQNGVKAQLRMG